MLKYLLPFDSPFEAPQLRQLPFPLLQTFILIQLVILLVDNLVLRFALPSDLPDVLLLQSKQFLLLISSFFNPVKHILLSLLFIFNIEVFLLF